MILRFHCSFAEKNFEDTSPNEVKETFSARRNSDRYDMI